MDLKQLEDAKPELVTVKEVKLAQEIPRGKIDENGKELPDITDVCVLEVTRYNELGEPTTAEEYLFKDELTALKEQLEAQLAEVNNKLSKFKGVK